MTAGTNTSPFRSKNETPSSRASCPGKPAAAMGGAWETWWFPCRRERGRGDGVKLEGANGQRDDEVVLPYLGSKEGLGKGKDMGWKERDWRHEGRYLPGQRGLDDYLCRPCDDDGIDMASTTTARASLFDTGLISATSLVDKGKGRYLSTARQLVLFRRTYPGMGTGVSRLGFQEVSFLSKIFQPGRR